MVANENDQARKSDMCLLKKGHKDMCKDDIYAHFTCVSDEALAKKTMKVKTLSVD